MYDNNVDTVQRDSNKIFQIISITELFLIDESTKTRDEHKLMTRLYFLQC
jgi:hypothetical protein